MQDNIIALGEWQVQHLTKLSDFKTCEGIGNQCHSKTSFTPHTKASHSPYLDSLPWLQGCDRSLSWEWPCGLKTKHSSQLAPESNKPEGIGREI